MKDEIKEILDKIKKCLIAGYDMHIISQEELNKYWNYITILQEENEILKKDNDALKNNYNLLVDTLLDRKKISKDIYIEDRYDSKGE